MEEILNKLSKEQLIFIIMKYKSILNMIGNVCVDESKYNITSLTAIDLIRQYLALDNLHLWDEKSLSITIDFLMRKITSDEYVKLLLGE